jgi:hypothetical protein
MIYQCTSCNFKTRRKNDYNRHLVTGKHIRRVNETSMSLEDDNQLLCKYCQKAFKHRQNMYRHIKYSCKKNKDEGLKELVRLLNKQVSDKDKKLQTMQKQIDYLAYKLQLKPVGNYDMQPYMQFQMNANNMINSNHFDHSQNYDMKIMNFKDTDYTHLTHKDYLQCANDVNHCVKTMISKVHLNEEKPENMNVYISSLKDSYVMVYSNDQWTIMDRNEHMNDMYDKNEYELSQFLQEFGDKYPKAVKSFERYLKNKVMNDNLAYFKKLILMEFYNKREIIRKNKIIQETNEITDTPIQNQIK